MKVTLMIEGSASALAAILASLPADASVVTAPMPFADPVAPVAPMIPAMPAAPTGGDGDDEANDAGGGATDGSGLDADGLPWDERIHASTKTKTAKNTWTKVRNGPKGDALAAIEAELRARAGAPTPMPPVAAPIPVPSVVAAPLPLAAAPIPVPAPAVMAPPVPVADPALSPAPVPIAMPMPEAVPVAAPIPMPVAAPAPAAVPTAIETAVAQATGTLDFAQFMQHLSGKMTERDANGAPLVHADYLAGITAEISTAFAPHGIAALSAITDIASNPQMISYAVQLLQRDGRW